MKLNEDVLPGWATDCRPDLPVETRMAGEGWINLFGTLIAHGPYDTVAERTLMTDKPDVDTTAQWVRALAQTRGLDRAYALYPDAIAAAVARGVASLGPLPADFSSVTEPAVVFDAAKFGGIR